MEGLLFGGPGLIYGGKFAFQNWVSLIVGSKFTIFALFYFIFAGKFPSTSPWGAYIWRGDLTALGCFALLDWGGGLIFGSVYFQNFTVHCCLYKITQCCMDY